MDVILTNTPANIAGIDVIATGIGDREMPGCVRKIDNSRFNPTLITCRDHKTYNAEKMKSESKKVGTILKPEKCKRGMGKNEKHSF